MKVRVKVRAKVNCINHSFRATSINRYFLVIKPCRSKSVYKGGYRWVRARVRVKVGVRVRVRVSVSVRVRVRVRVRVSVRVRVRRLGLRVRRGLGYGQTKPQRQSIPDRLTLP